MLKTKTVTHEGPGKPLTVTVSEASALMGMCRSVLISEALTFIGAQQQAEKEDEDRPEGKRRVWTDDDRNLALYLLRRYAWPDCIACTVASQGFDHADLTFEDFCELPEVFIGLWQQTARELNPHWAGPQEEEEGEEDEAAKKKEPDPEESESGSA